MTFREKNKIFHYFSAITLKWFVFKRSTFSFNKYTREQKKFEQRETQCGLKLARKKKKTIVVGICLHRGLFVSLRWSFSKSFPYEETWFVHLFSLAECSTVDSLTGDYENDRFEWWTLELRGLVSHQCFTQRDQFTSFSLIFVKVALENLFSLCLQLLWLEKWFA